MMRSAAVVSGLMLAVFVDQALPQEAADETGVPPSAVLPKLREFEVEFPPLADGRRVVDVELYRLFVANDFITFLSHEDETVSSRLSELDDKPYQLEKYKHELRGHVALVEEFRRRREAVSRAVLYFSPSSENDPSVEIKYIGKQFRLLPSDN